MDLSEQPPALAEALRAAVSRILATLPGARVACLNVLRTNRVMLDSTLDAEGRNKHAQRLAELRLWAHPLQLPEGRATFHVLEAVSPAAALLEYATANRVDHIVLGARGHSLRRKLLGSVAGEVAAEASCTVTVVRPRPVEAEATS
ncbi:MAG TPA: universal stress protein [Acetobacteraceae bacterium]|nr:universal stress protein [Acetobacteraceae bacterium]